MDMPLKSNVSENVQTPKIPQNIETPSRKREIESSGSMKTPGYGSASDKIAGSLKSPVFGSTSGSEKTPGSAKTPGSGAKSEMHNLIATNLALESVFLVTYRVEAAHGPVKYIGSGMNKVEYINRTNVSEIVCTLLSDDIIGGAIGYLVGCYKRLVEKVYMYTYVCMCIYAYMYVNAYTHIFCGVL
jgi:hypothetical protein